MKSYAVIGLGFGDEGKGKLVDYLCREKAVNLVVRFNGGSQAGHNVVTADGRHHCFSQFGAGSFNPGVQTLLSRFHLLDPIALFNEANDFFDAYDKNLLSGLYIDARCIVVTPYHVIANRLREVKRGADNHGSVGKGIGETVQDSIEHPEDIIFASELAFPDITQPKLERTLQRKHAWAGDSVFTDDVPESLRPKALAQAYWEMSQNLQIMPGDSINDLLRYFHVVFEGAQGVLLDQDVGFAPHNTWSVTTDANVRTLVAESGMSDELEVIGVTRCYGTRHGAGPFPAYIPEFDNFNPGEHNKPHEFQGNFRSGGFDLSLFRYALNHCTIDHLCINHLDLLESAPVPVYFSKIKAFTSPKDVIEFFENYIPVPIKYLGYGPSDVVAHNKAEITGVEM